MRNSAPSIPNLTNLSYTGAELDNAILSVVGHAAWRFWDGADGISRPKALIHCGALLYIKPQIENEAISIIKHALGIILQGDLLVLKLTGDRLPHRA